MAFSPFSVSSYTLSLLVHAFYQPVPFQGIQHGIDCSRTHQDIESFVNEANNVVAAQRVLLQLTQNIDVHKILDCSLTQIFQNL
jgi:hypothetical protein